MIKRITILTFMLLPLSCVAQSTYDSLLNAYSVSNLITQRKALNINYKHYIQNELSIIADQEMKQLATCAIVQNIYGVNFLSDSELMAMTNSVLENPANEIIHAKATALKKEMLRELVGSTIKPLAFPTPQGDSIKITDLFTSGKDYIVIDLWATWCGPCIASMKKFNAIRNKYNVEFYSILVDDTIEKVEKFTTKNPAYTWPIVVSTREAGLHAYLKIRAIPSYIFVDKNGVIVSTMVGGDPERELKKLYRK